MLIFLIVFLGGGRIFWNRLGRTNCKSRIGCCGGTPETPLPSDFSMQDLESTVDPLAHSDEYGIDLYIELLLMIKELQEQ